MKQQTEIACPICGNHSESVMPLPDWGEMRKCTDCGLIFADPMTLPASAEEIFSKAYNGKGEAGDFSKFANKLRYRRSQIWIRRHVLSPTMQLTLRWLRHNLPRGATVLEIGCGPGYFMHTLRQNEFRAIGIEPGEKPTSILKGEGFQVWHGTLDNYPADWPIPDAVVSFFMIHHLPNPGGFFATLRRLFPSTPIIISESHVNTLFFATRRDVQGSLPPRYFTWWNRQSLARALWGDGFEATVSELPYNTSFFVSSIINVLAGTGVNVPSFLAWMLRGTPELAEEQKSVRLDYPTSFRQRFRRFTGMPWNLWAVASPFASSGRQGLEMGSSPTYRTTQIINTIARIVPPGLVKRKLTKVFYEHINLLYRLRAYDIDYYRNHYKFRRGDVVVDVGAHRGLCTISLAKLVGNEGRVIAIEPDRDNLQVLKRATSGLANVVIIKKGLWSSKGTMRLHINDCNDGHSLLEDMKGGGEKGKTVEIQVDTLDNILAELNINTVHFVKMNIEGAEIEALRGARRTLENNHLSLAIEAHHEVNGEPTYRTIIPMLKNAQFDAFLGSKGVVYAQKAG